MVPAWAEFLRGLRRGWRDAVNQALEQLVLAPPAGIETGTR